MKRRAIDLYKRFLVRKSLYGVHRRLFNISLWGLGVLNSENFAWSGEDHFLADFPRLLGPGRDWVIFDVGAKVGDYAARAKAAYPEAAVYAFEPHPHSYAQLERRGVQAGFHTYHTALGDQDGTAVLFTRPGNDSEHASLYREVVVDLHGDPGPQLETPVARLDSVAVAHGIERIHALKIDAEGSELSILKGAQGLLAAGQISIIQFEFNEMNIISRAFLRDFAALLPGYVLHRLLPDGMVVLAGEPVFLQEIFAFQNIVAIRAEGA